MGTPATHHHKAERLGCESVFTPWGENGEAKGGRSEIFTTKNVGHGEGWAAVQKARSGVRGGDRPLRPTCSAIYSGGVAGECVQETVERYITYHRAVAWVRQWFPTKAGWISTCARTACNRLKKYGENADDYVVNHQP